MVVWWKFPPFPTLLSDWWSGVCCVLGCLVEQFDWLIEVYAQINSSYSPKNLFIYQSINSWFIFFSFFWPSYSTDWLRKSKTWLSKGLIWPHMMCWFCLDLHCKLNISVVHLFSGNWFPLVGSRIDGWYRLVKCCTVPNGDFNAMLPLLLSNKWRMWTISALLNVRE